MYPSTVSLALKGAKSAYEAYADHRDKKAAELYDTMQDAKKVAEKRNKETMKKASALADDARGQLSPSAMTSLPRPRPCATRPPTASDIK